MSATRMPGEPWPPPHPPAKPAKPTRPRSSRAAIASALAAAIGIPVGVVLTLTGDRPDNRAAPTVIVLDPQPPLRLITTPGVSCSDAGDWMASWAVPTIEGSQHDDEFNRAATETTASLLAASGFDDDPGPFSSPSGVPSNRCETGSAADGFPALNFAYAKADTTLVTADYVSLIFRGGSWGGGSHEYGTSQGLVFDLVEGFPLTIHDVLSPESEWQTPIIEAICGDVGECAVKPQQLEELHRFAISATGITFLFADCELSSCATARNEVQVQWKYLERFLQPSFARRVAS